VWVFYYLAGCISYSCRCFILSFKAHLHLVSNLSLETFISAMFIVYLGGYKDFLSFHPIVYLSLSFLEIFSYILPFNS